MNETIINGIDVSECVFFREKYTRIGDDVDNDISFENHCMLSECTFNIENCEKINCHFKQLKRLQKENKELKKRCEEWALETVKMQGVIDGKDFKIDKYKQALEEIREMLKKSMSLKSNAYNHFINVEKAIDKINEVLNDRD